MTAASVTESDYRANVLEMFKALDMDRNDYLDWTECRDLVKAVMKQDGGYNAESFKTKYDGMDKNDDGKISKSELVEAVITVGRERGLFGKASTQVAVKRAAPQVFAIKDDPNEEAVDAQTFRQGLSCLGKTFNNARHAYLRMDISNKSLSSLKVSTTL